MKLIQQGAEAKIYLDKDIIQKHRISKGYRHPQLDKQIRTRRTRSETKILTKALSIKANVPKVLNVSDRRQATGEKQFKIYLEFIDGNRLSETLNSYPKQKQFQIMQQLGKQVALLHENNIIHGDLTTSNIILKTTAPLGSRRVRDKVTKTQNPRTEGSPSSPSPSSQSPISQSLYLIDFGLGFISTKIEDKAVDIHLIKQALEAKHFQNHTALFTQFLKTYKDKEVIERLKTVEKRGRYKH